jgi:hypothetical protein
MGDRAPLSTLHPRLRETDALASLRAAWRDGGRLRVPEVLDPGLAAEIEVVARGIEVSPRIFAAHEDLSWSVDLRAPVEADPQHPPCLVRLARFLARDLPVLAERITGRRLAIGEPGTLHFWQLRKGAYVDDGGPLAPPGGLDAWLGLTGIAWPAAWGGHVAWAAAEGVESVPPAFDVLDLSDGGRFRVPLLTRHVRATTVRAFLVPAGHDA